MQQQMLQHLDSLVTVEQHANGVGGVDRGGGGGSGVGMGASGHGDELDGAAGDARRLENLVRRRGHFDLVYYLAAIPAPGRLE